MFQVRFKTILMWDVEVELNFIRMFPTPITRENVFTFSNEMFRILLTVGKYGIYIDIVFPWILVEAFRILYQIVLKLRTLQKMICFLLLQRRLFCRLRYHKFSLHFSVLYTIRTCIFLNAPHCIFWNKDIAESSHVTENLNQRWKNNLERACFLLTINFVAVCWLVFDWICV